MTYLTRILEEKQREIQELKKEKPSQRYVAEQAFFTATRDFTGALRGVDGGLKLIALSLIHI